MKPSAAPPGSYDAFLSYSHKADGMLAPALQRGLQGLAKPWNRPRALRVFRDQASLAANPDLWTTIEKSLAGSRYFVLLASPESARSPWVGREIAFWKQHRGPDTMLIVLTDGEIVWDDDRGDFAWERTTALPGELRGWFRGEPLWVDLRWTASEPGLSLSHGRFREAVGMLAAAVHGVSKDELDSEEVRQHARTVRLRRAGVAALTVLAVIALIMANLADQRRQEADRQRRVAEEQRRLATVRALQAEAENIRDADPLTSLQLSLAALRIKPTTQAREGLLTTLQRTRLAGSGLAAQDRKWSDASYSTDGTLLATTSLKTKGVIGLWDTRDTGRPRRLTALTGDGKPVQSLSFSADGRFLATVANAGRNRRGEAEPGNSSLMLWDLRDRGRPRKVLAWKALDDAQAAAFSPDGRTMAVVAGGANGTLQLWDVTRPAAPRRLTGPLPAVDSDTVMFSPDGHTLVTGSDVVTYSSPSLTPDTLIHTTGWTAWDIHDVRRPRAVARRPQFDGGVFSRAAPVLAVRNDRTLTLWDLRHPQAPRQLGHIGFKDWLGPAALSPDGRSLAVSVADNTVFLYDISDPAHPSRPVPLGKHPYMVDALAFSSDGRTVSLADHSGTLTRWLVRSRAPSRVATLTMNAFRLTASAFSPDGRKLAIASSGNGTVWLWDTSHPSSPRKMKPLRGQLLAARAVSFNGDGTVLAVAGAGGDNDQYGDITLWDTSDLDTPRYLGRIHTDSGVAAVALSPSRPVLAAAGSTIWGKPWAGFWNVRDPRHPVRSKLLNPYEPQPQPSTTADSEPLPVLLQNSTPAVFGPDGTTLALPDALWDVTDPSAPTRLTVAPASDFMANYRYAYSFAAFSADGRHLVTASGSDLSVWSVRPTGGLRFLSSAQDSSALQQIDIHAGGHLVATGNHAGRAVLWAVGGSAPPIRAATLTDAAAEVADVRFSHDRTTLAVTLDSGTVELWNVGDLPAIAANPAGVACGITERGLSRREWQRYAPGIPYQPTC
ncbi:TIR domain-containing protein [Streptomyces achromogenes]|uniref:TIR domain-containing protein n=1 Tax=Streptomyces achromogenes TaxID=67255 RepID=UPI00371A809D